MLIFIKIEEVGKDGGTVVRDHKVEISEKETVRALKTRIDKETGVSSASQRLVFGDEEMLNSLTLGQYGIKTDQTVQCYSNPYITLGAHGPPQSSMKTQDSPAAVEHETISQRSHNPSGSQGSYEIPKDQERRPYQPSRTMSDSLRRLGREGNLSAAKRSGSTDVTYPERMTGTWGRRNPVHSRIELPFLTQQETEGRIKSYMLRAEQGRYDADTYIVDPVAHYCHLDYLERHIITSSEYFRNSGHYDLEDNVLPKYSLHPEEFKDIPKRMLNALPEHLSAYGSRWQNVFAAHQSERVVEEVQWTLESLWKSLLIISRILTSVSHLKTASFSGTSYNMLVLHPGTDIAELIQVSYGQIETLREGIETAINRVSHVNANPDSLDTNCSESVAGPCSKLLNSIRLPVLDSIPMARFPVLTMCRMTVVLLDIALVSYVGSHGTRFDSYLESGMDDITIGSNRKELSNMRSFKFNLKSLACLNGFLDNTRVWVFQTCDANQTPTIIGARSKDLSILTRMKDFADIWGPVWPVPASDQLPDRFREFNLSRGCVRAVESETPLGRDTVMCHWYSSSSSREWQPPNTTAGSKTLSWDDQLLIGAAIQENTNCRYTTNHYEGDYGPSMGYLGTVSPSWRLSSRQIGLQLGQYVSLTATGTQKKLPGVTLKEHIWNKFRQSPRNANIEWLDNYFGVNISHCTGNAIRVRMKDLFRMPKVRERLNRYSPNWEASAWGVQFVRAIADDTGSQGVRQLWQEHEEMREDIAKLICALLELLHPTGEQGQHLIAAYFGEGVDKQVELEIHGNEWAKCLRDSVRSATYAVIGDACLTYPTTDQSPEVCNLEPTETAFETQIILKDTRTLSEYDFIRLDPVGEVFRAVKITSGPNPTITLSPFDGQFAVRMLHANIRVATEMMEKTASAIGAGGMVRTVVITASSISYGGMTRRRQHVRRPHPQLQQDEAIQPVPNGHLPETTAQSHQHQQQQEHTEQVPNGHLPETAAQQKRPRRRLQRRHPRRPSGSAQRVSGCIFQ